MTVTSDSATSSTRVDRTQFMAEKRPIMESTIQGFMADPVLGPAWTAHLPVFKRRFIRLQLDECRKKGAFDEEGMGVHTLPTLLITTHHTLPIAGLAVPDGWQRDPPELGDWYEFFVLMRAVEGFQQEIPRIRDKASSSAESSRLMEAIRRDEEIRAAAAMSSAAAGDGGDVMAPGGVAPVPAVGGVPVVSDPAPSPMAAAAAATGAFTTMGAAEAVVDTDAMANELLSSWQAADATGGGGGGGAAAGDGPDASV